MSVEAPDAGAWSAEQTSPGEIELALRRLLEQRSGSGQAYAPSRVLNLIVVADAAARESTLGRLERIGRSHPSRTVLCLLESAREGLDAMASMSCDLPSGPGEVSICRERVEISLGPGHLPRLGSIVGALLVPDLPTVTWVPCARRAALDGLAPVTDAVLLDSSDPADPRGALVRALEVGERAAVVDLAWTRARHWRERIAAAFEPPVDRAALGELASVEVGHHPGSAAGALLLLGWLCATLGWRAGPMSVEGSGAPEQTMHRGHARSRGGADVALTLRTGADRRERGLADVRLASRRGRSVCLTTAPGGTLVVRREADGRERSSTMLGPVRDEGAVLGEGIRQALAGDASYQPALGAALALAA